MFQRRRLGVQADPARLAFKTLGAWGGQLARSACWWRKRFDTTWGMGEEGSIFGGVGVYCNSAAWNFLKMENPNLLFISKSNLTHGLVNN